MASQMILALAVGLVAVGVSADNCARVDSRYVLKATLTSVYCPSADLTCDSNSNCPCGGSCCELGANCYKLDSTGTACGTDRTLSGDTAVQATAATTANYDTTCCVAKPTCGAFTCSSGWTKKTGVDSTKCSSATCTDTECCDRDTTKCMGVCSHSGYSSSGNRRRATMTIDEYYCSNCGSGKVMQSAMVTTASATATFDTDCCTATTTTTTVAPTCASHTCTAGYMMKSSVTSTTACGGVAGMTVANRCAGTCCECDNTKCLCAKTFLNTSTAQQCATATEFEDTAKYGTAVSAAADWKATCCTARTECTTFKAHSYSGSASGAEKMQRPFTGLLLLITTAVLASAK